MGGLTGSTVLVSGAARGIGAATARALAAEGARLVLFDVDAQPLQELVAEIGEDRAVGTVADVRDLAAVQAVRLEVARHGVAVGSAHMAWIDTPLIRDARADLPAFDRMLATLPGPLGRVHAVDECAAAFVRALENRSRRVYVPGSMRILAWAQPLITSATAERFMLRMMSRAPNVDDRVAALGRSMSARILAALPARQPSP